MHRVLWAGDVLKEGQPVHVHTHLKTKLNGDGLSPLVEVEGLEVQFHAAEHARPLCGSAKHHAVVVLDFVIPLPRIWTADRDVDGVLSIGSEGHRDAVVARGRHHPVGQDHRDMKIGAAKLLRNDRIEEVVGRIQRRSKTRFHHSSKVVVLDRGKEVVDRRIIDVGRQKVEESKVDRLADRAQHDGMVVAHRRGTCQAVMLVHPGHPGFCATRAMGVIQTT